VALGGTSYAAFTLPDNSVGNKQLKNGAVTTSKIKNGAVTGPKINFASLGTVPKASHAIIADSTGHASRADSATTASQLGGVAAANYQKFGGTLPSGDTETGAWGSGLDVAAAGQHWLALASFPTALATGISTGNTIYVSGSSATHCPGAGKADPGYLCLYQGFTENANTPSATDIFDPATGTHGAASVNGFAILLSSSGAGTAAVMGSYAVTAS
jgi:hypothetical protein